MSFLDPTITEQTEIILNNPVERRVVRKSDSVPGSTSNGIDTPMAYYNQLKRAVDLLSEQYDNSELSPEDEQFLKDVFAKSFEGQY
jgi:hypothetical protein